MSCVAIVALHKPSTRLLQLQSQLSSAGGRMSCHDRQWLPHYSSSLTSNTPNICCYFYAAPPHPVFCASSLVVAPVHKLMTSSNPPEAAQGRALALRAAVAVRQYGLLQELQKEFSAAAEDMEAGHNVFVPFLEVINGWGVRLRVWVRRLCQFATCEHATYNIVRMGI